MSDEIREIVLSVPELESVKELWAVMEQRAAQGDAEFLGGLGVALVQEYGAMNGWQYRSIFDRLLRLLAGAAKTGDVSQTLRVVAARRETGVSVDRYAASLLAAFQTPAELAGAFAGGTAGTSAPGSDELRACLVHELVLRDVDIAEVPEVARWATSAAALHHPLGWLPLGLAAFEERRDLPNYSLGGSGYSMPYGSGGGGQSWSASVGDPGTRFADFTTETETAAISPAVQNWLQESNGLIEAKVFYLELFADPEVVAPTLLQFGLECLSGDKPRVTSVSVSDHGAQHTWRELFAAASTGGAYSSGAHGAYGRLFAWRSLAGLAGAAPDASAAQVAALAKQCAWYRFDAKSSWFEGVAWDISLLAVRADRRTVAVLAATDTD